MIRKHENAIILDDFFYGLLDGYGEITTEEINNELALAGYDLFISIINLIKASNVSGLTFEEFFVECEGFIEKDRDLNKYINTIDIKKYIFLSAYTFLKHNNIIGGT